MTDEEKIEALKQILGNGAQVHQINLGNGEQNFYLTKDTDGKNTVTIETSSVEVVGDDEAILEPGIFNARIFDTNAKLVRLRDEIGARIKGARLSDESRFAPDRHQIDPKVQKEWYYIWKPLNESELFARNIKVGATVFIQQMLRWYPEVFPEFADEKARDKFINNLMQSISAEKSKWMKGDTEVPIKDMAASCASLGLVYDNKIQSMFFVCNEVKRGVGGVRSKLLSAQ